jgi:DNA-directed RNA polymerase specialized sigma24 family protein
MSPSALRRYRAERLLRKDFPELRAKVLAVVGSRLRAKGVTLDQADLESCYAQAFHGLYATVIEGVEIENPTGWLVTVTFRRAIDESRSTPRRGSNAEAYAAASRVGAIGDGHRVAPDYDIAHALDDRATLRQVFEGLRSSLSPRECEAASLCYLQGFTRAQAAKRMGMTEMRMRKLMEGAGPGRPGLAGKVGALLSTIKAGEWCEQQSSLMRAYAFSILAPEGERYELAAAHLRECPACRAHVASLRGLAAVLPPLPLTFALAGGSGAAAGTTVGGGTTSTTAGSGAASAAGAGSSTGGGAGWMGGIGSLTAKLAVLGVVAAGAGIALHGSGAHGSAGGPARRSTLATQSIAGDALSRALFSASPGHVGTSPSKRRSVAHRPAVRGAGSVHGPHSAAKAASSEFSPEHVHGEASAVSPSQSSVVAPAPAPSPSGSTRTTGEFGFE